MVWFGLCLTQQGAEGLTHDPVMFCPTLPGSWRRTGTENTTWLPWGRLSLPSLTHTKAGASPSQHTSFHLTRATSAGPREYLEIHLLPGAGHQVAIPGLSEFKIIPGVQGGRAASPSPGDVALVGHWERRAGSVGGSSEQLRCRSQQLRNPTGSRVTISSFSSKIELVQSQNLICEPSALDSKPFTLSGSC